MKNRKRSTRSLQRKSKRLPSYYCLKCGMIMSCDKELCAGCEEAQQMFDGLKKMVLDKGEQNG